MVQRAAGRRSAGLGLARRQPRRRGLDHGVSDAREGWRADLGRGHVSIAEGRLEIVRSRRRLVRTAPRLEVAAHPRVLSRRNGGDRRPDEVDGRTAHGRPGARRAIEHGNGLLGRRGARGRPEPGARLPRAYGVLGTAAVLERNPTESAATIAATCSIAIPHSTYVGCPASMSGPKTRGANASPASMPE